jgi:hypothetical protein
LLLLVMLVMMLMMVVMTMRLTGFHRRRETTAVRSGSVGLELVHDVIDCRSTSVIFAQVFYQTHRSSST